MQRGVPPTSHVELTEALCTQSWRVAQKKWGPALLPAPTAPSEGYAGVRNLVQTRRPATRSRSWLTSSGVASHRTAPS